MPVKVDEIEEVTARINRKYENSIRHGDVMEEVNGIPTGSLELDIAMGGQGLPQGRVTRLYGGYSSAKTLTSYNVIAEAQKMGLACAYYNIEKQYSPEFVKARGVNTSKLTLVEGTTIEEVGDKLETLLGVCHVHVIDSCSQAVSEDELNASIRDWRPGLNARAWGKVFRRINERFDNVDNTIILIDQVRTNFRTGAEEAPGGRILDHQSSMTVHFKKGSWLWRDDEGFLDEKAKQSKGMSGQIEPSGIEIRARVEKSRVCRPFRSATMRLDLDTIKFDRVFELMKAARHYEIVTQRRSYYYYTPPGGDQSEPLCFQGEKKLRQFVESDLTLQEQIVATSRQALSQI